MCVINTAIHFTQFIVKVHHNIEIQKFVPLLSWCITIWNKKKLTCIVNSIIIYQTRPRKRACHRLTSFYSWTHSTDSLYEMTAQFLYIYIYILSKSWSHKSKTGYFGTILFVWFRLYSMRKLIWHKCQSAIRPSISLFYFDCEITLSPFPELTNTEQLG